MVEEPEIMDLSVIDGKKVNKAGNIVDENGKLFEQLAEGERIQHYHHSHPLTPHFFPDSPLPTPLA